MTSLQKISAIIIAAATVGVALPAMAQRGDSATIQENGQSTVVTGSGNSVTNRSTQTNVGVRNGRGTSGNNGVVQRNDQATDAYGNRNVVNNGNTQSNTDVRNTGIVRIRR
jgi:hypothetical protein